MSVALDTALSSEYGNSYVDVAYADSYWTGHYDSTKAGVWQALSTQGKTTLLIHACRMLEQKRFVFSNDNNGTYSPTLRWNRALNAVVVWDPSLKPVRKLWYQALQFPRNLDYDLTTGAYYVPEPVKMAQCEQAIHLATFDDTAVVAQLKGIKRESVSVGDIKTLTQYSDNQQADVSLVSPIAYDLIKPFIIKSGQSLRRA
jgi:hypothetical protein